MAVTSILSASRKSGLAQVTAGLGAWLTSTLVGLLVGHSRDPILDWVSYPPTIQLVLTFVDQDSTQAPSKGRAGRLLIDIHNTGKGRAVKARLGLAVLRSGMPVRTSYQGATLLGDIESGGSRQAAVAVSTRNMPSSCGFTLGVTCTYETQWGARDEETGSIVLNSASTDKP